MNQITIGIALIMLLLLSCQSKPSKSEAEIVDSIQRQQQKYIDSVTRWPPHDVSLRLFYTGKLVEADSILGSASKVENLNRIIDSEKIYRRLLDSLQKLHNWNSNISK
jgi:hypothetical protein